MFRVIPEAKVEELLRTTLGTVRAAAEAVAHQSPQQSAPRRPQQPGGLLRPLQHLLPRRRQRQQTAELL